MGGDQLYVTQLNNRVTFVTFVCNHFKDFQMTLKCNSIEFILSIIIKVTLND